MNKDLKNVNDKFEINDEALDLVTGGLGEITSDAISDADGNKDRGLPNTQAPFKSNTFLATKSRK